MALIDLNADLGEGVTDDPGLLAVVTSANVACGSHAGDVATMTAVCEEAARRGVAVGAQVSYDDRASFGRARLDVAYDVLRDQVADQVFLLERIARHAGLRGHLREAARRALQPGRRRRGAGPRGRSTAPATCPCSACPARCSSDLAAAAGREVRREGFPDRGYTGGGWTGRLLPRDQEGALVGDPDEVARRAVAMARSGDVDSVCVHGDSPGAVATGPGGPRGARGRRHRRTRRPQVTALSCGESGRAVDVEGGSVDDTPTAEKPRIPLLQRVVRTSSRGVEISHALPQGKAGSVGDEDPHSGATCCDSRVTRLAGSEEPTGRSETSPCFGRTVGPLELILPAGPTPVTLEAGPRCG